MDKYLVKLPKKKKRFCEQKVSTDERLKQTTLYSLKRVVVIEQLITIKRELSSSGISTEALCDHLSYLCSKLPSVEVLKEINLGKVVKALCKHSDQKVADLAKKVVQLWTEDIRRRKLLTYLDVRCDKKIETLRNSARNMLCSAIKPIDSLELSENDIIRTSNFIEKKVYFKNNRQITSSYKKVIRKIVFALKRADDKCKCSYVEHVQLLETFLDNYV